MTFKIIIICIMIIFYGSYFLKSIILKKRGIKTNQLGIKKIGLERRIEIDIKIMSIITIIIELLSIILNTSFFPFILRWFGVCLSIIGVIFFIFSIINMKNNWRAGVSYVDKTNLVTSGIYKISRNPAFLGFYLLYIGILVVFFNVILLIITIITIIFFHLQIVLVEEKFLKNEFNNEYLEYKKTTCRYFGKLPKNKIKRYVVLILSFILITILIIFPLITINIYEFCFGYRLETSDFIKFDVSEFEDLKVERCDFYVDNNRLAGYKYYKENCEKKGVIVFVHGLGGGGHNSYMPLIDYFTNNYYCFTYDACGNDLSDGYSVKGLPEGIKDLDFALNNLEKIEEYDNLPIYLVGHSYGAYSILNNLSFHKEIKGIVIFAGFCESTDLLSYFGTKVVGKSSSILLPYFKIYEKIKFGNKYTNIDVISSLEETDTNLVIVHSNDDTTVPKKYCYDKLYNEFKEKNNFTFYLLENKGHSYMFYSDDSFKYRDELNELYNNYIKSKNLKYNEKNKNDFLINNLDKEKCFELNIELLDSIFNNFE